MMTKVDLQQFKYKRLVEDKDTVAAAPQSELAFSHVKEDPAEQYSEWAGPLKPLLQPGLYAVFVGFNPGLESARVGHYYAHRSNRFWKFLYISELVDRVVTYLDDERMPSEYNFGFTDLVARSTRGISELTVSEMTAGVKSLEARIRMAGPTNVCLIGKGIYHAVAKVKGWRSKDFAYGKQSLKFGGAALWVFSSTSGLVSLPQEKQLVAWRELAREIKRLRGGAAASS